MPNQTRARVTKCRQRGRAATFHTPTINHHRHVGTRLLNPFPIYIADSVRPSSPADCRSVPTLRVSGCNSDYFLDILECWRTKRITSWIIVYIGPFGRNIAPHSSIELELFHRVAVTTVISWPSTNIAVHDDYATSRRGVCGVVQYSLNTIGRGSQLCWYTTLNSRASRRLVLRAAQLLLPLRWTKTKSERKAPLERGALSMSTLQHVFGNRFRGSWWCSTSTTTSAEVDTRAPFWLPHPAICERVNLGTERNSVERFWISQAESTPGFPSVHPPLSGVEVPIN